MEYSVVKWSVVHYRDLNFKWSVVQCSVVRWSSMQYRKVKLGVVQLSGVYCNNNGVMTSPAECWLLGGISTRLGAVCPRPKANLPAGWRYLGEYLMVAWRYLGDSFEAM